MVASFAAFAVILGACHDINNVQFHARVSYHGVREQREGENPLCDRVTLMRNGGIFRDRAFLRRHQPSQHLIKKKAAASQISETCLDTEDDEWFDSRSFETRAGRLDRWNFIHLSYPHGRW